MIYLAAGLALLALFWGLSRAFLAASPATLALALRWTVGIGGVLALAVLVVRGLIVPALVVAASVIGALVRFKQIWDWLSGVGGPRPGQSSDVETPYLRMSLDHDTGEMSGTVRQGPFQGRRLEELSREELLSLHRTCRAEDDASASLVEAFLDRAFPGWHEAEGAAERRAETAPRRGGAMTEDEAWEVLDVPRGSPPDEITAAHRRLMMKLHPDQGGSTWLAARLNEARDILLHKRRG